MMPTRFYPDVQANNPFRRPDWRWQRVLELVAYKMYLSIKRDDEPTRTAAEFLRKSHRSATERRARKVTRKYPGIVMALQFQQSGGDKKLELECRVLARQLPEVIAVLMALPVQTVRTYTKLFFDLEGRINAHCYIRQLLGPGRDDGDVGLMKWCVYSHGPALIVSSALTA